MTVTVGEVTCPGCDRSEYSRFDGFWLTCRACGKRYSPRAAKKALKRAKK